RGTVGVGVGAGRGGVRGGRGIGRRLTAGKRDGQHSGGGTQKNLSDHAMELRGNLSKKRGCGCTWYHETADYFRAHVLPCRSLAGNARANAQPQQETLILKMTTVGILVLCACAAPRMAAAQTMQWTDKGYISVN